MGLKVSSAFVASFMDFVATIFGTFFFVATSFFRPSMKTTWLPLHFFNNVVSDKFFRGIFSIVAVSLVATLMIVFAPACANFHVSFSGVSIVKFGSEMCFMAATL